MNRLAGVFIIWTLVVFPAYGGKATEISRCAGNERKRIAVPKDKGVLVEPKIGPAVIVWLSTSNMTEATYRWRLVSHQQTNSSGQGRVFEDYEQTTLPNGPSSEKKEQLRIFAGGVVLDWSAKDKSSGWTYYCPSLAAAKLIDSMR